MAFDPSRRVFLKGTSLAAVGFGMAPTSLLTRAAEAATAAESVLVVLFLRGAADGLNLCVPYGDPSYASLRPTIGLGAGEVSNLDGFFGMHPGLAPLQTAWGGGRLAFVHAVGNYDLSRSHFDAQDFMESGTPGNKSTTTGWLSRTVGQIPGTEVIQAAALATQQPRSFLGAEPVLVAADLASFALHAETWRAEADRVLRSMYAQASGSVAETGREMFQAIDTLASTPGLRGAPANGASYPAGPAGNGLRQAAQLVRSGLPTRCIFVNVGGGFDTHANQLAANATDYAALGQALTAFDQDLGGQMDRVVVMVQTEFGRTAAQNGTAGTDHGSAHCMILLGGRVRGGRVLGRWPGLSRAQLYEERDLAVTTDFRDVYAEILRRHLGISDLSGVLPGFTPGAGVGAIA